MCYIHRFQSFCPQCYGEIGYDSEPIHALKSDWSSCPSSPTNLTSRCPYLWIRKYIYLSTVLCSPHCRREFEKLSPQEQEQSRQNAEAVAYDRRREREHDLEDDYEVDVNPVEDDEDDP